MSNPVLHLLILLAIAIFLILRLKNVLGTRDGFEKPPVEAQRTESPRPRPEFEVIEGGPDRDITDHVPEESESAKALAAMKQAEPSFSVSEFLGGARQAYEMIFLAFERGDIEEVRDFLDPEVAAAFDEVIEQRRAQGVTIDSQIVGVRDTELVEATFDETTRRGEITVRFLAELTTVVKNAAGEVIEGDPNQIKRQRDAWTFGREMGADDPNWQLVATGE